MCNIEDTDYSENYTNMSVFEQKLIDDSRRGKSNDKHSVIFLKDKTLAVIAPYTMPLFRTNRTVQCMINRWAPDRVKAIALPRAVA